MASTRIFRKMIMAGIGTLFVVATPIGNLGDISRRALDVLESVDLVAAEDTRHSAGLLRHFGISTRLLACHDYNERQVAERLLSHLQQGRDIALISDAGTPLISDPGYHVVRKIRAAGVRVIPVPGPSSIIAALSVAGLPTDRFVYEGFLPAKSKARRDRLQQLVEESRTVVMLESSHRIVDSVNDIADITGGMRELVLARELTKRFEEIHADSTAAMCEWLDADPNRQRGEFVLMLAGAEESGTEAADLRRILEPLLEELPLKQASALAARISGEPKNAVYKLALAIRDASD
jgi:16S rRNA (cytidine1402-2'-O)-methyltransferase